MRLLILAIGVVYTYLISAIHYYRRSFRRERLRGRKTDSRRGTSYQCLRAL